jgi:lipoic acid synthetase
VECVERISKGVRAQANWQRSLDVLKESISYGLRTKTGIMVGLGETEREVKDTMEQIVALGVQIFTIGQYLQPTKKHLKVEQYVAKEKFDEYKVFGESIGFKIVESGPLVRSSYHADEQARTIFKNNE